MGDCLHFELRNKALHNYKPRSVAEDMAKRMIELALDERPGVAIRAFILVADRTEGKPGKSVYHHQGDGEITIEYVNDWRPPQLEVERGDVFDEIDFGIFKDGATFTGRHTEKLTVEDCVTISMGDFLRCGFLPECEYGLMTWRDVFDEQVYSLALEVRAGVVNLWKTRQTVTLESMPLHFGGLRWWFLCPRCSRRCAKLYLLDGRFACRVCQGLAYTSQRLHRGFTFLTALLRAKGKEVSQAEVERVCMQIRRDQCPRWIRKRDRRPDYKPLDWRRQEIKRQLGTLWLGDDLA